MRKIFKYDIINILIINGHSMNNHLKLLQKVTSLAAIMTVLLLLARNSFGQIPGLYDSVNLIKPAYGNIIPVCGCEDLLKATIPNADIESAVVDSKGGFCQVTAIVSHTPANDRVKVWIALPLRNWNGRFYGTGGGGFVGGMAFSLRDPASRGFAAGATNAGHEEFNGSFALDAIDHHLNWQEIRDFAYLGVHDMTIVGKALILAFYGKPASYSYFVGGSNGGRQALTEVQRYPEDYDGVLSLCPAIYWTRVLTGDLWPQAVMNEAKNLVSKAKLDAVTSAMIAACDIDDGVADGVVDDPLHCAWDPKAFTGTSVGEDTFTVADAYVVRKIWEGPRTKDGSFLWYGMPRGSDLSALAGTTGAPLKNAPNAIFTDWAKYFLLTDPKWDISSLNWSEFELLWNQSVEQYSEVFFAENPDLSRFRDHGGKLLILHGLADQLVSPQGTTTYLERIQSQMGGAKAASRFARLFLVPGVNHGFIGKGPGPVGTFDALVRWVEEGKAPDRIMAESRDKSGKVIRTRPLFPYPRVERIK
jgi:pimeloyl-ACP methyl ester carboxylesterase